jgi:hypothetical protein
MRQIGNAVPVAVAELFARRLQALLAPVKRRRADHADALGAAAVPLPEFAGEPVTV